MNAEKKNPLHMLLKLPTIYSAIQSLLSKANANAILYGEIISANSDDKILDLGCGPASHRRYLKAGRYTGVDFNPKHIEQAKTNHPGDEFIVADIDDFLSRETRRFDKILLIGVLHHLDDAKAEAVIAKCRDRLAPDGKVFTLDPLFERRQNPIAFLLAKLDQGNYVRCAEGYQRLARAHFGQARAQVRRDLARVPYSIYIMSCFNSVADEHNRCSNTGSLKL